MTISKTFIEAFSLATVDPKKAKGYLGDLRLNNAEKKILEGYLNLRLSEFQWIEDNLSSLVTPGSTVDAVRQLVLGISRNNSGRAHEALPFLNRSLMILRESNTTHIHFIAVYNLFVAYQNLTDKIGMKEMYEESLEFKFSQDSPLLVRQLRQEFNYWSVVNNDQFAYKTLKKIE
jgi:hypothetical protein